ncbi:Tetratricopeptide repeat-containing protein [Polaribacter sp. KT25b]|uniref:tetratricopeptide repeat protein n=1 Tax=Polaribacter sp. KT25b TaxID=1855336 RepID=UPI00087D7F5C|nr:tetratricopeptide repeat protein [Polaribacter sp. KT25b]SDR72492.1 Tetratricopeptide repeat-containing protein [Polaribacter sp. KT25b]
MKLRFVKKHFLSVCCFLAVFTVYSQQTIVDANVITDFNNALELYNNKAYAAAQKVFEKIQVNAVKSSSLKADASYYDAMCAVKLNQTDADQKVLDFVDENPTSNKKNKAFFNVANYYFANKKASYALKWYTKVNVDLLSKENQKELNFKMGYSLLVTNNLELAKNKFLPLINDAKYGNDARYYYGFISYKLEDYGLAESTLKEIADNKSYKAEISYYLLDISFKSGKFERCIIVGTELLKTSKRKEASEISKIVGESYFNLGRYQEAIPYLKAYKGQKGKWTNTDYYQLGYVFYVQNDYVNAINYFNKIIDEKNAVSQNAYYHLAECYLNIDKKTEALNAFKTASEMTFNPKIQEDAALNYAKLSYEAGNPFQNISDVLQDYLKKYPNSSSYNEINELVVSSFIHQQDYKGALDYLKKKNSVENTALTTEVSLYRGIQLFNDNKYKESLSYFAKGKESKNEEIYQKALYWEAETLFRLKNYEEAVTKFVSAKRFIKSNNEEFSLIDYNIGYSYFKLKEYNKAINAFKQFLADDIADKSINDDALVRLGDSYFATRNYADAINSYQIVVRNLGTDADYAEYQIGMSHGFRNESEAKIKALTSVVNNFKSSSLKDDALFQLANTYIKIKNNEKAHQAYERLLQNHPKSSFLSKALVRQGLLYYGDNQNKKALEKFKLTVQKFPNTSDAIQAVNNAKNIYLDEDNLDEYVAWVKKLNFINVSDDDLDNSTFLIAERKYFEGKNNKDIIVTLNKYLEKYPKGAHNLKANYYLADILFKDNQLDKAIANYKVVLKAGTSEYSEDTLAKLSQIYLEKEDFEDALPLLERLEQEAYIVENVQFAQSNLMKGYYETEAYKKAISYAKKVLSIDKDKNSLIEDAKTIIARSSFKIDDFDTAQEYYNSVEKNATGELKAETLYYNSFFKNQQENYEASNKVIQELIADYSAYKYWGVKSYVIMGKNYYSLKDAYQATFILENVIKNFSQYKDIVDEAQIELTKIKENEAKTNNSIIPKN